MPAPNLIGGQALTGEHIPSHGMARADAVVWTSVLTPEELARAGRAPRRATTGAASL